MTGEIDETVFAIVGATPSLLRSLFAQLPPDARDAELDDGWSVRHCLAHVLDTEEVIVGRMRRIVADERPFIRSIDAPARLRDGGYLARDTESLLADFETRRAEGIAWLKALSQAQLDRVGDHDESGRDQRCRHRPPVGLPRSHAPQAGREHHSASPRRRHGQHPPLLLRRLIWSR
jgi:DinB superfamily